MHGTISKERGSALETDRTGVRPAEQLFGSTMADIARTLWPEDTAPNIAATAKCSVRAAEYYLAGQRDWSGDALAAIVSEILKRHALRNIRVEARR